jgi:hypothetical protein
MILAAISLKTLLATLAVRWSMSQWGLYSTTSAPIILPMNKNHVDKHNIFNVTITESDLECYE